MFKKILSFLLAAIIAFSCISVFSANEITLAVNGKKIDTPVAPFMQDGTTMVPVASILRELGYVVTWIPDSQVVNAVNGSSMVTFVVGKSSMIVGGKTTVVSPSLSIINGTTFVPVRSVCEMLGCRVVWNDIYKVANVMTADYTGAGYIPTVTTPTPSPENTTTSTVQTPNIVSPKAEIKYDENIYDPVTFTKDNKMNAEIIAALINEERVAYGRSALEYDADIAAVAQRHSNDMKDYYSDEISHYSPNSDEDPFDRLDNANIHYIDAAEVLASGFTKTEDVVKSWMNSPAHKDVILDLEYTHIGVGYAFGGSNGTYWTVYLISR